ncbi:ABC transporter permease [Rickettsiales endosymbiont of Stachyamoeba lipophora]|uniref:ABC transporter permease n=1 Tax=Rickettsiales endosymbiont of Stachyamoeba lipophora TaxID=2486578 RepID=UPI000F649EDB|nr:ABC transporter permease [Rickettsiales endosymbiont of Stachyamoeba lipophora]AZL15838.1 ABC transporter permease [Rickettsiales endosymbiont of Stachyamoeba lipophora]
MTRFNIIKYLFTSLILLFLLLPIVVTIAYSFNSSSIVSVWQGFSLEYYYELFNDEFLLNSLFLSLKVAFIAASVANIIALMISIVLMKQKSRFILKLLTIQIMIPEVVNGLALVLMFVMFRIIVGRELNLSFYGIIMAHIAIAMPYMVTIIYNKLKSINVELIESAMDLGANNITIWHKIIWPLIMPSMVTAWLIAFTISMDDVVLASFTSYPGAVTLPMQIYSKMRFGVSPEINALATILITINFGLILLILWNRKTNLNVKTF